MKKIKNVLTTSLILSASFLASFAYANPNAASIVSDASSASMPATAKAATTTATTAAAAASEVISATPAKAQDTSAIEAEVSALIRDGKLEQALSQLDAALLTQPDPNLHFQKGVVLSLLNRVDDAISVFTKVTELYPSIAEPYNNLGILYVTKKDWLRARAAFETAIQNRPEYPNALDNLGDLYVKMAANAYQKNLALDANNQVAASKLNVLNPISSLTVGSRKVINAATSSTAGNANTETSTAKVAAKPAAVNSAKADKAVEKASEKVMEKTDKASSKNGKTLDESKAKTKTTEAKSKQAATTAVTTTATSAPTQLSGEQLTVLAAVNNWAKAWSQKNANAYLKAYSDSFKPASTSLTEWKADRKEKIGNKGHIKVILNNPEVNIDKEQTQATVKFVQNYESDKLKDVTKKTLVLVKKNGAWLIEKEANQ